MGRSNADRAREMEVFVECIEAGSFSAGGRQLGQSPSAISRTIARLEDRLGVRLVIRNTRSLVLTTEGATYFEAAKRILGDLDETEQTLGDFTAARGTLRVNASIAFGSCVIVPLIPRFLEAYPQIVLDLSLQDTLIDLKQDEADVAIRVGPLPDSDLLSAKLGQSSRVLVAASSYLDRFGCPGKPEDLASHNCLRFNFARREMDWPFCRDGSRFSVRIDGDTMVDSGEAMARLASAGHGIARIGRFHVARELASGDLIEVLSEFDAMELETFHAVFLAGTHIPARARLFVDFLTANLLGRSAYG